MYGAEHIDLYKQRERKMMAYGTIADYQRRVAQAKKYNEDVDKVFTDFFKVKHSPLKANEEEIEMKELRNEIRQHVLSK